MASKKGSGNSAPIQDEQKKSTEQNEKATETVKNETESGDSLFDFVKYIQTDFRFLTRFEFICTVACSDSDSK